MAGNRPEERVPRPVIRQSWRRVTFVHWRVEASEIGRFLPGGLIPDVVDGSAWIGLTPFSVERFTVLGVPPLPIVSSFPETNLRTYVRHRDGRDGLWFLSLDVGSTFNVVGGRLAGVPYFFAAMSVDDEAGAIRYRCRRLVGPRARHDVVVEPGDPVSPGDELAFLLAGRWRAFVRTAGRLVEVPVEHEPWPLRHASLRSLEQTHVEAARLPAPSGEPLVHHADGVDARLGTPRTA